MLASYSQKGEQAGKHAHNYVSFITYKQHESQIKIRQFFFNNRYTELYYYDIPLILESEYTRCDLVSLFNGISIFVVYLMPNPFF